MALYLIKDLDDDYHSRIGIWQITETEAELRALSSIPSDELEEISYIKSESLDRDFSAVEKKALSEEEIEDLDDEKRNEQLAIYWCAKEAVYKKMSQYNVDFAEQIEIESFRPRGEGELEATFTDKDGYEESLDLQYMTFDRHVLVWIVG